MKSLEEMTEYVKANNQFKNDSDLWKVIMNVLKCSDVQAKKYATTHCNSFSFHAVLFAEEYISITYQDFFSWGYTNGAINEFGFLRWEKDDILKVLCSDVKIKAYVPTNFLPNGWYQLKIENNHGTHFMLAYMKAEHGLLIFDTGRRGVCVKAKYHLFEDDEIIWAKKFMRG